MRLRQLVRELDASVEWVHRAFILLPEERERQFTEYYLRHRRAARELTGLPYDLPPVGAPYPRSSLPALEAAEWVKRHAPESFAAFDLALYEAFFAETRDIGDPEVLVELAGRTGAPTAGLREALRSRACGEAVRAEYRGALELGVQAIPTVIIGGELISGAVPYAEYLAAARRAAARRAE